MGRWSQLRSIDTGLLGSLLIGSLAGVIIGTYAATLAPGGILRTILAVVLLLAAKQLVV